MPRTIEFDSDTVLSAAMHEFRRHGYAGASIKSLERATGLSSGSLYNSFGDKDELFVKALAHYNNTVVRKRIKEHLEGKPPADGIRSLFLSLLREPDGCLLTNSAVEFGAGESVARAGVQEGLSLLENAFRAALDRLEPNSAHMPVKLLALYQGILVLIRFGRPKRQIGELINSEINLILGEASD